MSNLALVKRSDETPSNPKSTVLRLCDYCGKPFTVESEFSRQMYHDPDIERRLAVIRKKLLIEALAVWLWDRGLVARDMRKVAAACIEAEPRALFKAVQALGWRYDLRKRKWKSG